MSAIGEPDAGDEREPLIQIQYPTPSLETLELDSGDHVLYDEDNPDAWYQIDVDNIWTMDGRWR